MQRKKTKLLSILNVLVIFLACADTSSDDVLLNVSLLKNQIDTVLVTNIHPLQSDLRQQIVTYNQEGKDTFELAKNMIKLKKIDFLLNNTHDQLNDAIEQFQTHKINKDQLMNSLSINRSYVDSLTNSFDF